MSSYDFDDMSSELRFLNQKLAIDESFTMLKLRSAKRHIHNTDKHMYLCQAEDIIVNNLGGKIHDLTISARQWEKMRLKLERHDESLDILIPSFQQIVTRAEELKVQYQEANQHIKDIRDLQVEEKSDTSCTATVIKPELGGEESNVRTFSFRRLMLQL